MRRTGLALLIGAALAFSGGASAKPASRARPMVIAAANPLAVEAGMKVLRRGGDAVDAAIAVQAMLGLVEPQSSGLGGGAFMLRYDARTKHIEAYDGRETAPATAGPDMFLDVDKHPLPRGTAMTSGRATGVPGVIAMLKLAHGDHGRLAWRGLFESTARRADAGFPVTERLARFVRAKYPQNAMPDVRAYFTKADGSLVAAGDSLRNPAYAKTLRRLAANGTDAIYRGDIAKAIAARVAQDPIPGSLTAADIAAYRPVKRDALCGPYRVFLLCSFPPPGSGVGILQLMATLERTDIAARGPDDPQAWFLFAEASRVMYADRDAWVGDPAFVKVPVSGLLNPAYVDQRRALIKDIAGAAPVAGTPPGSAKTGIDATREPGGTSHFVISDARGNVISMTTTVESYFGSGRMVDGFFLNNQMTDFSFLPEGPNAVAPGKRPRSSMAPMLILDGKGRVLGALGSPGGNAIPAYVGKTLIGLLDWHLPMQKAIDLPNLVARGTQFNGEVSRMSPAVVDGLTQRGVAVKAGSGEDSGLHGIIWHGGKWDAGADSRRDGVVRTDWTATSHRAHHPRKHANAR